MKTTVLLLATIVPVFMVQGGTGLTCLLAMCLVIRLVMSFVPGLKVYTLDGKVYVLHTGTVFEQKCFQKNQFKIILNIVHVL